MRIEFDEDTLGSGPAGLEIGVKGFRSSPTDAKDCPSQVYIEVYQGTLRVHVWDGSSEDPVTSIYIPAVRRRRG